MLNTATIFRSHLLEGGLHGAMRWLNSTAPYRFTAIFGFDGETLKNLCLVDKLDSEITGCPDLPVSDSYCIYIQRSAATFAVQDSLNDRRVDAHPKQAQFHSYYGVPLFSESGELVGTVCHFDPAAMTADASVAETLHDLTSLIAKAAF